MPVEVGIDYDTVRIRGILTAAGSLEESSIWQRLIAKFAANTEVRIVHDRLDLP